MLTASLGGGQKIKAYEYQVGRCAPHRQSSVERSEGSMGLEPQCNGRHGRSAKSLSSSSHAHRGQTLSPQLLGADATETKSCSDLPKVAELAHWTWARISIFYTALPTRSCSGMLQAQPCQ